MFFFFREVETKVWPHVEARPFRPLVSHLVPGFRWCLSLSRLFFPEMFVDAFSKLKTGRTPTGPSQPSDTAQGKRKYNTERLPLLPCDPEAVLGLEA